MFWSDHLDLVAPAEQPRLQLANVLDLIGHDGAGVRLNLIHKGEVLPLTQPALRGTTLYGQGAHVDASANPTGVVVSNGLALTVGAR